MDTHSAARPGLSAPTAPPPAAPAPTQMLASRLSAAAGERSDQLRARYMLIIDIDHLMRTGETRHTLGLRWSSE